MWVLTTTATDPTLNSLEVTFVINEVASAAVRLDWEMPLMVPVRQLMFGVLLGLLAVFSCSSAQLLDNGDKAVLQELLTYVLIFFRRSSFPPDSVLSLPSLITAVAHPLSVSIFTSLVLPWGSLSFAPVARGLCRLNRFVPTVLRRDGGHSTV